MFKKKAVRSILAVLLGITIVASATYAWFSVRKSVENEFKTADIDNVIIVEEFEPPTEWMPGVEVEKKVLVAQTGTGNVVVRVKLTELLKLLEHKGDGQLKVYTVNNSPELPANAVPVATTLAAVNAIETNLGGTWADVDPAELSAAAAGIQGLVVRTNGTSFLAYYVNPSDNTDVRRVNIIKSAVAGEENDISKASFEFSYYMRASDISDTHIPDPHSIDHSVIHINFSSSVVQSLTGWAGSSENWYYGGDGYYYYGAVIGTGQASKRLLDSVTLDGSAADVYKNMEYTLTVNMEAVQATLDAIKADWSDGADTFDIANPSVWSILQGFLG